MATEGLALPSDRPLVLVVEDDRDTRELLVESLAHEGFDAVGAENGAVALEVLRGEARPDVVLLDLRMPVLSGWDLLRIRQADPRLLLIPVIVMTGEPDFSPALHRVTLVRKPVNPDRLAQIVRTVLEQTSPDPARLPRATEPWTVDAENPSIVRNSFGYAVAYLGSEREARRVVAAVNAVSQVSTAALESGIIDKGLECLYEMHRYDTDSAYREEIDRGSGFSSLIETREEVAKLLGSFPRRVGKA